MGPMVIELYWNHAPDTCRNFAELARRGYYNGEFEEKKNLLKTLLYLNCFLI